MNFPTLRLSVGRFTLRLDLTAEPSSRMQAIAEINELHEKLGGSTALFAELDGQADAGEMRCAPLLAPRSFGFSGEQ